MIVNTETEEEVAVKILPYESADDVESLKSEINALKRLSSPFVVSYIDSYKIENEMWIIMEYCGGGSMSDILSMSADHLLEQHLQAVMAYCVLGLQHVHSLLGIHRVRPARYSRALCIDLPCVYLCRTLKQATFFSQSTDALNSLTSACPCS